MFKILLAFIIVYLISHYLNFSINAWQILTENIIEKDDGGPIFFPRYITINPFEVLEKNTNEL